MGIPKTLADVVRVLVVIHVLVMTAMIGRPRQHTVLKGGRAEKERHHSDRPTGLKCLVRKQAMVAERDAQSSRDEEHKEQPGLEEIDAVRPDVVRHHGHARERDRRQERAVGQIDFGVR